MTFAPPWRKINPRSVARKPAQSMGPCRAASDVPTLAETTGMRNDCGFIVINKALIMFPPRLPVNEHLTLFVFVTLTALRCKVNLAGRIPLADRQAARPASINFSQFIC